MPLFGKDNNRVLGVLENKGWGTLPFFSCEAVKTHSRGITSESVSLASIIVSMSTRYGGYTHPPIVLE